jgi:CO/xanthine dehydrogenase FAD-binding subunit
LLHSAIALLKKPSSAYRSTAFSCIAVPLGVADAQIQVTQPVVQRDVRLADVFAERARDLFVRGDRSLVLSFRLVLGGFLLQAVDVGHRELWR